MLTINYTNNRFTFISAIAGITIQVNITPYGEILYLVDNSFEKTERVAQLPASTRKEIADYLRVTIKSLIDEWHKYWASKGEVAPKLSAVAYALDGEDAYQKRCKFWEDLGFQRISPKFARFKEP